MAIRWINQEDLSVRKKKGRKASVKFVRFGYHSIKINKSFNVEIGDYVLIGFDDENKKIYIMPAEESGQKSFPVKRNSTRPQDQARIAVYGITDYIINNFGVEIDHKKRYMAEETEIDGKKAYVINIE